jgi:tRNA pseudouridine55 synthase
MANKGRRIINAVVLLDKPAGLSSHSALKKVQYALKAGKAGHLGTLDPLATGMLPIALGEATKLCGLGLKHDKRYRVSARLGQRSDTLDRTGSLLAESPVPEFSLAQIERQLAQFRGAIMQIPPMFSALKQGGEALHVKARRGEVVERQARPVRIHELKVLSWQRPLLTLEVECSAGTYVRTLVDDLGTALGCGALVDELCRLWVEPFRTESMVALEHLSDAHLLDPSVLVQELEAVELDAQAAGRLKHGQRITLKRADAQQVAVFSAQRLLALAEIRAGVLHPKRILHLESQRSE